MTKLEDIKLTQPLFIAGAINMESSRIINNQLCNVNFLQAVLLQDVPETTYLLADIQIRDNTIWAVSESILFSALFSSLPKLLHSLIIQQLYASNNDIQQNKDSNKTQITNLIAVIKIFYILLQDSSLTDSHYLSALSINYSIQINVDKFECSYSAIYADKFKQYPSSSCLELNEANNIKISYSKFIKKVAFDSNIISIQNQNVQSSSVVISMSTFQDILIIQSKIYKQSNPIIITASYSNFLQIESCNFQNNTLQGISNSLVPSTSGVYVNNLVGEISIFNSTFTDMFTNSDQTCMNLQIERANIKETTFKNTIFKSASGSRSKNDMLINLNTKGGSIYLKAKNVKIDSCSFFNSESYLGGFLYFSAFSQEIQVLVYNSSFIQSFTRRDGSAFYIEAIGFQLNLIVLDSKFEDLFQFFDQASLFRVEFGTQIDNIGITNQVTFYNVNFKNIFGQDLSFIFFFGLSNVSIQKSNYEIENKDFRKSSLQLSLFQRFVPASYCSIKQSSISLQNIQLQNIKDNYNDTLTHQVFFTVENSNLTIIDTALKNIDMNIGGIGIVAFGNAYFNNINFTNINFSNRPPPPPPFHNNPPLRMIQTSLPPIPFQPPIIITLATEISFILIKQAIIRLENVNVSRIFCSQLCLGGFIQALQSDISIINSNFIHIQAKKGGVIYLVDPANNVTIQKNTFQENTSQTDSGAIMMISTKTDDFNILIDSNIFLKNECLNGKGGSIYFTSPFIATSSQCLNFVNNTIQHNKALIGGGIKYEGIVPTFKNNSIISNVAKLYGQNIFSYPNKLQIINTSEIKGIDPTIMISDNQITLKHHRSGGILPSMKFQLFNEDGDHMKIVNQTEIASNFIEISISPNDNLNNKSILRGSTKGFYEPKGDYFQLSNIDLVGQPNSKILLEIKCDQIKLVENKTLSNSYYFALYVNIDTCQIGEVPKLSNNLYECIPCDKGQYSFDKAVCSKCPTGAECLGGANLIIQSGYWRRDYYEDIIIKCEHLQANCIGGTNGNSICYKGHIGPLCEECDIQGREWGESFVKSGKYSCAKCSEINGNNLIVVIMTLWTLISIIIAVKSDTDSIKEINFQTIFFRKQRRKSSLIINQIQKSQNNSTLQKLEEGEDQTGVYLKIFTNYFQIISSIASFNLNVPSGVFEFPSSVGQPIQKTINSLDCILKDIDSNIPIIYLRFIFSLIMPIVYLLVLILGLFIYKYAKKIDYPIYMIYTGLIFLLIYVQPDLISQMIALLSCRQIGNYSYILSNISYECYTSGYYQWGFILVFPSLLAYSLIFPTFLYRILVKNKKNLRDLKIKLKYGFLYKEYTSECFYWEFFKMAEKIFIILALNFYSQDIKTKGILVFIAISLYGIGSIRKKPYLSKAVNKLDQESTLICSISVLMGIFLYENYFSYFFYIAYTIIIVLNVWFILLISIKIIRGYTKKLDKLIYEFLLDIGHRFKFITTYLNKKQQSIKKINPAIKEKVKKILLSLLDLQKYERRRKLLAIKMRLLEIQYGLVIEQQDIKQNNQQNSVSHNSSICKNLEEDFNLEIEKNKTRFDTDIDQTNQFSTTGMITHTLENIKDSSSKLIQILSKKRSNKILNTSPIKAVNEEEEEQFSALNLEKSKNVEKVRHIKVTKSLSQAALQNQEINYSNNIQKEEEKICHSLIMKKEYSQNSFDSHSPVQENGEDVIWNQKLNLFDQLMKMGQINGSSEVNKIIKQDIESEQKSLKIENCSEDEKESCQEDIKSKRQKTLGQQSRLNLSDFEQQQIEEECQ